MQTRINREKYTFLRYKITEAPRKFKKWPRLLLGLELTMHVLKSQIHLARQYL